MKTIQYRLTGKPHNLDDCIDKAGREGGDVTVKVKLSIREEICGIDFPVIISRPSAEYIFHFGEDAIQTSSEYTGFSVHKNPAKAIAASNRKHQAEIARLDGIAKVVYDGTDHFLFSA